MRRRAAGFLVGLAVTSALICPAAPALAQGEAPEGSEQAFTIRDPDIVESSGLTTSTVHDGVYYTINDSGDQARIFALDENGETVATLQMRFVEAYDWEAIAAGPNERIWVGDIGDNRRSRERITLYRFREPQTLEDRRLEYGRYRFVYPDGAQDAETLLVHPVTGRVYVVTKGLSGGGIYEGPSDPTSSGTNQLTRIADAPAMITDGAFLPDGSKVVLRSYGQAYVLDWPSAKVERRIALPRQDQGESLAITSDGEHLLVGSEGADSVVWRVPFDGPPPGPSPTPKPSATKEPEPSTSAEDEAAREEGGNDPGLLGGMPGWVPLTVVGIAVLAGVAAFPRGPRPPRNGRDRAPRASDEPPRRTPAASTYRPPHPTRRPR